MMNNEELREYSESVILTQDDDYAVTQEEDEETDEPVWKKPKTEARSNSGFTTW
jgi:hypothetical protein